LEDWLGREQFSIEEAENAKKDFPVYSNKFVKTIQRKEGKGFKLAKIHLLCHFVDNIAIKTNLTSGARLLLSTSQSKIEV